MHPVPGHDLHTRAKVDAISPIDEAGLHLGILVADLGSLAKVDESVEEGGEDLEGLPDIPPDIPLDIGSGVVHK